MNYKSLRAKALKSFKVDGQEIVHTISKRILKRELTYELARGDRKVKTLKMGNLLIVELPEFGVQAKFGA